MSMIVCHINRESRWSVMKICLGIIAGVFAGSVMVAVEGAEMKASVYYVSVNGNNSNPGTEKKPYRTIQKAADSMKEGDTCVISGGVYRETVRVRQSNVAFRGQGRVVITGCDKAEQMQPCSINDRKGLKTDVDKPVYDVFCGEKYIMPARYPNKTSPMTSNKDWEHSFIGPNGNIDIGPDHAQRQLSNLNDGYYVGLHGPVGRGALASWYSISMPITGVNKGGYISVDAENASSGFMGKYGQEKGLGYIIGAKAALDAPGEWYSDGKQVLLIPPEGETKGYEFRTRLYGALISGNGVRLENIQFKAAAAQVHGDNVSFDKCVFEYISPFQHNPNPTGNRSSIQSLNSCWGFPDNGTAGVFVQGDGFVAENCRFSKSWWCGMMLRGNKARVENCLFEDMNWMAKRSAGLFSWGDENIVRYCTFSNMGGAAIEGGNAMWIEQYAKKNVWEYNYIEDVCKLIVDQGFFYVNHQLGNNTEAGSVWRYNVGKGSRGPEKGNWTRTTVGYYVDNSSSGYHVHNNIAIDANNAIRYNDTKNGEEAGKRVWFFNNTFYRCGTVAYGCWSQNREKAKADADVRLINNIAIGGGLQFAKWRNRKKVNNRDSLPASVVKDPVNLDFTPVDESLKTGGVPVDDEPVTYVGAVDPEKGMWRYGADISKLPSF